MKFLLGISVLLTLQFLCTACSSKPATASGQANKVDDEPRVDPVFAPSKTSMDRNGIHDAVKSHLKDLRVCYDDALSRNPGVEGKVSINFDVDDRGQVASTDVDARETTLRDPVMAQCILNHLKSWSFPKSPRKQIVSVTFPFTFHKGSGR